MIDPRLFSNRLGGPEKNWLRAIDDDAFSAASHLLRNGLEQLPKARAPRRQQYPESPLGRRRFRKGDHSLAGRARQNPSDLGRPDASGGPCRAHPAPEEVPLGLAPPCSSLIPSAGGITVASHPALGRVVAQGGVPSRRPGEARRKLWHTFRRVWATERKDLPLKDVAAVGGWRDTSTLLRYQQPDEVTMARSPSSNGCQSHRWMRP